MSQGDSNLFLDDDDHGGAAGVAMAEASSLEDSLGDFHLDECRAGPAEEDRHGRGEDDAVANAEDPLMSSPSGDGGMGSTATLVVFSEDTQQRTSANLLVQSLVCCLQ